MSDLSWPTFVSGSVLTASHLNAVPTAVNSKMDESNIGTAANNYVQLDASARLPSVDGSLLTNVSTSLNIDDPTDDTWQGKTAEAVAGETLTGYQWAPLYCKDTGSGTRFYLYDADASDADNDTYPPIALLVTSGTILAGTPIEVTIGDGILANDSWTATQANVGKPIYCNTAAGEPTTTVPSGSGDHIKMIGTLLNIAANGRDVWDISFRYPDVTVP